MSDMFYVRVRSPVISNRLLGEVVPRGAPQPEDGQPKEGGGWTRPRSCTKLRTGNPKRFPRQRGRPDREAPL